MGEDDYCVNISKNDTLTERVLECLKFAVDSTRQAGGTKEIGIRWELFFKRGYNSEKEILINKGYLSRQTISENNNELSPTSRTYLALTSQGLDLYNNLSKEADNTKNN